MLYVWFSFSLLFFSFRAGCMVDFVSQALSLLSFGEKKKGFGQIGFLLKETKMVVEGRFCLNLLLSLVVVLST